jgi:hypothetical protein
MGLDNSNASLRRDLQTWVNARVRRGRQWVILFVTIDWYVMPAV